MDERTFAAVARAQWDAMPERFRERIKNVALLIEDEPDEETRTEEGLEGDATLLGLYRGIPATARGSEYGMAGILPDTITLYRLPILALAQEETDDAASHFPHVVRKIVQETLWHEVGHHFGLDEEPIARREQEGTNRFEA